MGVESQSIDSQTTAKFNRGGGGGGGAAAAVVVTYFVYFQMHFRVFRLHFQDSISSVAPDHVAHTHLCMQKTPSVETSRAMMSVTSTMTTAAVPAMQRNSDVTTPSQ